MSTVQVSLVLTVYNEARSICELLDSIATGEVLPGEIVIADGGSTDRTCETIANWVKSHPDLKVRLLQSSTRINIARGRNLAVRAAEFDRIAVIDAGCIADARWLKNLTAPFFRQNPPDVIAGWYEPVIQTTFHERVARAFVPKLTDVQPDTFLPSSRSVAFTRTAWSAAGGYPEHLRFAGEDTLFDLRLKRLGFRFYFAGDAVVYWRLRDDMRSLVRQYYQYGYGDGEGKLLIGKYLFRCAACLFPPLLAATGKGWQDFWLRYRVYIAITTGWLCGVFSRAR